VKACPDVVLHLDDYLHKYSGRNPSGRGRRRVNNASTAMREKHTNELRTRILYTDGQRAEICVEQLEQITNEPLFLVPTESYRKL